jgi:acetyl esterase/lipase
MSSLKSRLIPLVLRYTRKKAFSSAAGLRARIKAERGSMDYRPPKKLKRMFDVRRRRVAGMPVYEVQPKSGSGARRSGTRVLYLHGGAYVFQITPHHWWMVADMATRMNARITVPIYPLAPEHTVDRTFEKMMRLYRRLLHETNSSRIVFMGDSAGAHMSVVMCMTAAMQNLPLPSRQVLISPGLDMSLANPKIRELEKIDPWLGIEGGKEALRLCAPGIELDDWRISPIYGDLSVLPRTMILTGTLDLLSADAVVFAEKARAEGVDMELVVEEGMVHVWPLIDMPEARDARNRIIAFITPAQMAQTAPVTRSETALKAFAAMFKAILPAGRISGA